MWLDVVEIIYIYTYISVHVYSIYIHIYMHILVYVIYRYIYIYIHDSMIIVTQHAELFDIFQSCWVNDVNLMVELTGTGVMSLLIRGRCCQKMIC